MSAQWFVEDEQGRRGPYTLDELRALRAAYKILPGAIITSNGSLYSIEDVLPEFKTGPLLSRPSPPPRQPNLEAPIASSTTIVIGVKDYFETLGIFLLELSKWSYRVLRSPFGWNGQFSLRTLLIFFLFVCPVLGIISNDISSTVRQQQIVNEWGGNARWRKDSWRFWRSDVVYLYCRRTPIREPTVLDQLPHLTEIHVDQTVVLTKDHYDRLMRAINVECLTLPETCLDADLEGISRLGNLYELRLSHPELNLTVRRLRGHPRLTLLRAVPRRWPIGGQSHLLNDVVTFPRLKYPEFATGITEPVLRQEYFDPHMRSRTTISRARFSLAVFGFNRHRLYTDLVGDSPKSASAETHYSVVHREADYFLTTPIESDPKRNYSFEHKELAVVSRVAWMADRVILSVDETEGMTSTIRDHCRLIRIMRVPSWVLVFHVSNNSAAERLEELRAECETEIGFEPAAVVTHESYPKVWQGVVKDLSVRPPTYHAVSSPSGPSPPSIYTIQCPMPRETGMGSGQHFSCQASYRGLSGLHLMRLAENAGLYSIHARVELTLGEEIAVVRDGHIYLGTVQPDDSVAP